MCGPQLLRMKESWITLTEPIIVSSNICHLLQLSISNHNQNLNIYSSIGDLHIAIHNATCVLKCGYDERLCHHFFSQFLSLLYSFTKGSFAALEVSSLTNLQVPFDPTLPPSHQPHHHANGNKTKYSEGRLQQFAAVQTAAV